MKVKTRFDVEELMFFIYGNEIRSARVATVFIKADGDGLGIMYGFYMTTMDEQPAEASQDDMISGMLPMKLKLMSDRDCFASMEKLIAAHRVRYEKRAAGGADSPVEEVRKEDEDWKDYDEVNFLNL